MEQMYNSQTLWQDFTPDAEPLDVNVLETNDKDGFCVKRLYFTGRSFEETRKTRVFATVYRKSDVSPKYAVLVVGDYSAPIDERVLKDLADAGFVAMSIDFAGRRDVGFHTLYPFDVDYCNSDVAPDMFRIDKTARETKFYEYALNCMRAITYLLTEEKAKKISLLTAGKGSYVGLIVLGVDARISYGALLFGSLYKNDPHSDNSDRDVDLTDAQELIDHLSQSEKSQMWTVALSPQAYASQIRAPMYVINSANGMFVDATEVNQMYYRINDSSRMLMLPLAIDFLPSEYSESVSKWLKGGKIPKEEELSSFYDSNGDYCLKIKTDRAISDVSVWYCANSETRAKYWVKAELTDEEKFYSAKLDLYEKNCDVMAFAVLNGDIAISTPILHEKVNVKNVKNPTNIIFSGTGAQKLISLSYDKWWNVSDRGMLTKGYLDIVGMKGKALATFALNDKSVRRNLSLTFSFDVCCSVKQKLYVTAVCGFGDKNESFRQQIELPGDGKWKRVTVEGEKFRRVDDGKSLSEKDTVDLLIIHADEEFIVNNLCLI